MHSALESKISSGKSSSKLKPAAIRLTVDLNLSAKNTYAHFSLKSLIQEHKQKQKQNKKNQQLKDEKRPPNLVCLCY